MLRAVVVEDNPIEQEYLCRLLDEVDDVQVEGKAETGPDALNLVARLHPDLIFLDIGLPGLDGLEVARQLSLAGLKPFIVFVTVDRQHAPELLTWVPWTICSNLITACGWRKHYPGCGNE